jgi:hypothetical protein
VEEKEEKREAGGQTIKKKASKSRSAKIDTKPTTQSTIMTMTMALLLPSLLPFFLILLSLIDHHHNVAAALFVSAAEESSSSPTSPLRCLSGWTRSTTLQTIPPDKINDGYCDCPLDGLDEVETGACSGSMDGMWAGIPPPSSSGDNAVVKKFVCPQQPSLQIPPSRINDGICDCCDGADEQQPSSSLSSHHHSQQQYYNPCPNVCDTILAKERAAYQKLQQDYTLGSQLRTASIKQYQKWNEDMRIQIQKMSTQDIRILEDKIKDTNELLSKIRIDLVKIWTLAVDDVLVQPILNDIVNNPQVMDVQTLGFLIVSLCQLSGETSIDQVVVASNGRCVPFDRASLDMGIVWDNMDHNNGGNYDLSPSFHVFDAENEESIGSYAEKLILRLEGKDNRSDSFTRVAAAKSSSSSSTSTNDRVKRSEPEPDEIDYDDFEEEHDFHYDDDYMGHSGDTVNEQDIEHDNDDDDKKEGDDVAVKFLLENLPLLAVRDSFKEHGKALLAASSATDDKADTDEKEEEEGEDSVSEDEVSDNSSIDPMALNMARSTISKRLENIARGETSSISAARFVAALIGKSSSVLEELQSLAIMTMYHSKLSSEDITEIIYTLTFPPDQREDGSEQTCSDVTPWSKWCPPVTIVSQNGGKPYPPPLIVAAAERRCSQRDNADGVCSGKEGEEKEAEFPLSVPDGYYSYYEPRIRSPADELSSLFAAMDSLRIPEDLTNVKKEAGDLDKKLAATKRELTKLEAEVDSSDAKYGVDGELFTIRDTCHKIESGKYEYEVCIFGKATQRDIGQNSGGTHLGSWDKVLMENGQRTLRWNRGTKCWNGPVRSAEVIVTCGSATKILSADEPETCRYVFTMESPIACDEQFKVNNSL